MDETTATQPVSPDEPPATGQKPDGSSVKVPLWLVAGLGGMVIGAGSVGLAWALSSDDQASSTTAAASPSSKGAFTLNGTMTLASSAMDTASGCAGRGGYDDIARGTAVTVYDENGKVLAKEALGTGKSKGLSGCTFPIEVIAVPLGPQFYQVEVSHRGKVTLPTSEAQAGLLGVSLT
ncbi:hypothetical protein ACFC26_30915 [Kitasatospora purpeofusca]|uniref:hypothetical protein n=1 Tax=Kitasatospora purpeofusca TaxID=67352 RepID=UPI0035D6BE38